jgi:murein DD-endopeptidase MepM/ murein hydrolase activator NlpD
MNALALNTGLGSLGRALPDSPNIDKGIAPNTANPPLEGLDALLAEPTFTFEGANAPCDGQRSSGKELGDRQTGVNIKTDTQISRNKDGSVTYQFPDGRKEVWKDGKQISASVPLSEPTAPPPPKKTFVLQPPLNGIQFTVPPVVGPINTKDKPGEGGGFFRDRRVSGSKVYPHSGIDINASKGTSIRAPADGVVTQVVNRDVSNDPGSKKAPPGQGAGTLITIDHGNGVVTRYFHLTYGSPQFKEGEQVKAGDVIATVGRTGNTPAAGDTHLHFEMKLNGIPVDPQKYLPKQQ